MKLLDTVSRLQLGLDFHQARHAVLTANLANVDTPNYRPRDLARTDAFDNHLSIALDATDANHIAPSKNGISTQILVDRATPNDRDDNSVNLDRESVKITANNVRYETLSTLVSAELGMLSYAAADGRGA